MELAKLARSAENEFVGVPCGIMDQAASMCGEDAHALLLDTRDLAVVQVPFDLPAAGLGLLVVDTRVKHEHGTSGYAVAKGGVPDCSPSPGGACPARRGARRKA